MLLWNGKSILKKGYLASNHKFSSPMAEYLYEDGLNGGFDNAEGDTEFGVWWLDYGKRTLMGDDRGFVWVDIRPLDEAKAYRALLLADYTDWLDN